MATETIAFMDSRLAFEDLHKMPERLRAECPSVLVRMGDWTEPFGWTPDLADEGEARRCWESRTSLSLFCPIGHLDFWPGSVSWSSFFKWSWMKDAPVRARFVEQATELSRVVGATFALVTSDSGNDGDVEDVIEAGGSVADAVSALARSGKRPLPLTDVPFVPAAYYTIGFP